jgi:enhancer of polycomb-like protein
VIRKDRRVPTTTTATATITIPSYLASFFSLNLEFGKLANQYVSQQQEYHLQAALQGAGETTTDNEIPVPPPQQSEVDYDEIYPRPFIEPRNYIKFSETVEETLGCLYDMTTEDEEYLKTYNAKKSPKDQLSEDDFEKIMELFEQTATEQAPFAAVDNTIVSFQVMAQGMVHSSVKDLQDHAKVIYEHWKAQRQARGNQSLHASLKFETHTEQDDMDPYVCFRRREVRQTRKTRQRDVQIADKLKKLRKELEDGRLLVVMSQQRELLKQKLLEVEKTIFDHRAILKEKKIRLGIKMDDEDLLINTKPQKRKVPPEPPVRAGQNTQLRVAVRVDGKPTEQDLPLLSDKIEEKWEELRRDIEHKHQTHILWNQNHIDLTEKPLPPARQEPEQSFRAAKPTFLPTPPSSASDQMDLDEEPASGAPASKSASALTPYHTGQLSPMEDCTYSFRRRHGRDGRLWVDRKRIDRRRPFTRLASPPSDLDEDEARRFDRSKYDQDDDSDEEQVWHIDPYDSRALKFRASIQYPLHTMRYQRQLPEPAVAAAGAQTGSTNRPGSLPAPANQAIAQAQVQKQLQSSPPAPAQSPAQPAQQPQASAS